MIKTIDVNAREWFDKKNENSYFSAIITINYGMSLKKSFKTIMLPFQYGYGENYQFKALEKIKEKYKHLSLIDGGALWSFCDNNKIILRTHKEEGCLKNQLFN